MAVRIPKNVAEAAKLRPGDHLELSVEGPGTVRIRKKKGTSKLRDLLREITAANLHTETDWGARRRQRTVVAREYVPDAGDLIWLDFTPRAGREQAGRRPAVVLSPRSHNEKTSLAVVCPVTSLVKGHPFEVGLPAGASEVRFFATI